MKRILIFLIAWVFIANAQGTLDTTSGWQYRIPITIQASMVDTDLDSFPFYFPLDSSLAAFWGNVNVDGSDIRITKSDKVTLCFAQLDTFNFSKADSVGELYWRGDASSTTDTKFYLYYGYSGAVADWSNQVWNEQYAAVYHFSENPANGSLQDWTANGNNGTPQGGMDAADLVSGQIGAALAWDFDGINDWVDCGDANVDGFSTGLTLFAIAKTKNEAQSSATIIGKDYSTSGAYLLRMNSTTKRMTVSVTRSGNDRAVAVSNQDIGLDYKMFAGTYNLTDVFLHENAIQVGSNTKTGDVINSNYHLAIGALTNDGSIVSGRWYGMIDEVRIMSIALNTNQQSTIYQNAFNPATFAIAGEIEAVNVQSNNNNPKKKSRYNGFGTGFKGGWRK